MTRRLLIVLTRLDAAEPAALSTPFYHAAMAAALDYTVDVFCGGSAARLLRRGVAATVALSGGELKTLYDWIKEAHEQGVRFWTCPANLEQLGIAADELIPECQGMMSTATMIHDVMEGECRVLSY